MEGRPRYRARLARTRPGFGGSTNSSTSAKHCVGPLIAKIQTLRDVKWEPEKLDEWFQQDGTSWLIRDEALADSEEMLLELAGRL